MGALTLSIEQGLEEIRSQAATGSVDAAHEALRAMVAVHATAIRNDYIFLQAVVFTGFWIADLASITQAVSLHFSGIRIPECRLSISQDDPPGAQIIIWNTENDGSSHFVFSKSLLALDSRHMFTIVCRWLASLRIVERYDTTFRPVGRVYLDVGDFSSGLGLCFCDNRANALLIPDSSFLSSNGYEDARVAFGSDATPWAARRAVAIWRGSSTGTSTGSLMETPRVQLCRLAEQPGAAELLDTGITLVVQATPEDAEMLQTSGLCKPYLPMTDHVNYKYQIDIDGNTNSWPGLFQKLLTGSPVLKIASANQYRQWYYSRLIPWYNYIPIAHDMSDLLDILRHLKRNDSLAMSIGAAGRRLAAGMTYEAEVLRCLSTVEAAFNRSTFYL
jgi:hypothetical protein